MERAHAELVDCSILEEIAAVMPDQLAELVSAFDRDCSLRLKALQAALNAADAELLRQLAHAMKGGAAGIGAVVLAARLRELELSAARADLVSARRQLEGLPRCSGQTLQQLRSWLVALRD